MPQREIPSAKCVIIGQFIHSNINAQHHVPQRGLGSFHTVANEEQNWEVFFFSKRGDTINGNI